MKGTLVKAISGFYYVNCNNNIYECKARGNFRNAGISPVVGDCVEITELDSSHGVLESVYERKNLLNRPPVANIDKLFIVSAYSTPSPNTLMIDRLCAIACFNNIEPIIVFNKCDMGDFSEWVQIYEKTGFKTLVVSANTGEGIEDIQKELEGCVSAFTGNSGVGKSSLLNTLMPELELKTGEVSDKLGRGRHTTRHVELFDLGNNCRVADTPGFSTIECDPVSKEEVAELFKEFREHLGECRFTSCSHTTEKGCAVLEAVRQGKIAPSRHESYCEQYRQAASLPSWERRK